MAITGVTIRFFVYDPEINDDFAVTDSEQVREVDEWEFESAILQGESITYARHTVRENGVSQICLTAGLGEG